MKTRDTKQYQVFFIVKQYYQTEKQPDREDNEVAFRKPIAVFDDEAKAKDYAQKMADAYVPMKFKDGSGVHGFDVLDQWVELEPAPENFNVDFNPEFVQPEAQAVETAVEDIVGHEVADTEGITVTKSK